MEPEYNSMAGTQMNLWDRLKVAAVLWAIFLLVAALANVFIDTSKIDDLVFHSSVFHILMTLTFVIVAPYFVGLFNLQTRGLRLQTFIIWGAGALLCVVAALLTLWLRP